MPDGRECTPTGGPPETERIVSEAGLQHGLFFQGLEGAPFGAVVASTDPTGEILYVNRTFTEITGYTLADTPTVPAWLLRAYPDEDYRRFVLGNWGLDVHPDQMHRDVIYEVTCRDGRRRSIQFRASILGPGLMFVMLLDVSERERVTRELKLREDAMASSTHAIVFASFDRRLTYVNPAFLRLWGYEDRSEVMGRDALDFWDQPEMAEWVAQDAYKRGHWMGELEARRKDGTRFPVWVSASLAKDAAGKPLCLMAWFIDRTEQRAAEQHRQLLLERMRHSERMEAIGQLAGGIAHDFNNILTTIIGNAELLRAGLDRDSEEGVLIGEILKAGLQAASLTGKLLAFARRGTRHAQPIDLHDVLRDAEALLTRAIDRRIAVSLDLGAERSVVLGDSGQLHAAFLNLGLNARDAIAEAGRIVLATRNRSLAADAALCREGELPPGDYIEVAVTDTGSGIPEEIRARIFEPFFTTKGPGRGTGLGLSGVYGCAKSHGGSLRLESEIGRGSTFAVLLPVLDDTVPETQLDDGQAEAGGRGHILLVDDEEGVRHYAERLLLALGYRVTCCGDGLEALAACERAPGTVDLVILDLVMPRLGGAATLRELRQRYGDLRVLIASGYDQGLEAEMLLREGAMGFLRKPFRGADLAAAVARCLDASPAGPERLPEAGTPAAADEVPPGPAG
ncbi:MAG: PAS domain S-box protein [Lentisphaeria bacterium]|nr:PAS domain S-box protein [Lentisphaeria bacterium]